jgi:hypothetical protein
MMLRKTSDPRKTSLDPAFEQTEAGMGARALWFQTAMLPSIGTAQHTALVSDLKSAFPEIYAADDSAEAAG